MGSAVRARQEKEKKNATKLPARAQAPKKIGPIETALLVGIPIVFGLCISYLFSRAAASMVHRETRRATPDFYAGAS